MADAFDGKTLQIDYPSKKINTPPKKTNKQKTKQKNKTKKKKKKKTLKKNGLALLLVKINKRQSPCIQRKRNVN